MKLIYIFIILTFFMNCASGDIYEENLKDSLVIKYSKTSRGSNFVASINREEVVLTQNGFEKKHTRKRTDATQWEKIISLVSKIKLEELSSVEAPSNNRVVDASAHTVLEIEKDREVYKTQVFDEGYPPKEITLLMEAIVTLIETVE